MARIDRTHLNSVPLPHRLQLATRFEDVDVQGHINNAATVILLQEARARFMLALPVPLPGPGQAMGVAGMTVEFGAELRYPDPVEIATGIIAIGRSSITFGQIGRQAGQEAIYAETTMVLTQNGVPAPISDEVRAALADVSTEQNERR